MNRDERRRFITANPGLTNGALAERLGVTTRTIDRDRQDLGLPALEHRLPSFYTHGRGGYDRGCRCGTCVDAWRAFMAEQKQSRLSRGLAPDDPRHGTENGYNNWGCRCDHCKHVWSVRNARYKSARRARANA